MARKDVKKKKKCDWHSSMLQKIIPKEGRVSSDEGPGYLSRIRISPARILGQKGTRLRVRTDPQHWIDKEFKYSLPQKYALRSGFFSIPDPGFGGQKELDSGFGSATLWVEISFCFLLTYLMLPGIIQKLRLRKNPKQFLHICHQCYNYNNFIWNVIYLKHI